MIYNFDKIIDRQGSSSIKYDGIADIWGRDDLLPMWVADMDLATPPFILDAIQKRNAQGILGYTRKHDGYFNAIIKWNENRYNLQVSKENIHFVPGIVPGIALAINTFTEKGDKVMIQPPVYHPFRQVCERNGREVVTNPLIWKNGQLRMDMEDFRKKVRGCKVFILCNPHNPGGLVWSKEELNEIAEICDKENVLVFSDEIHADLTLPPHHHCPFASVSDKARQNSVTFMSPSKAFNMPGLTASHALIFNTQLHDQFVQFMESCELGMGHVFAFVAVEAAYSHGTEWLDQCLSYIQGNIDFVDDFMKKHTPRIKVIRPQASFLIWLDCRDLNLSQTDLNKFFVNQAHLALNDGAMFGKEGIGFMRLNIGAPRATIQKAMRQLADAYELLQ